MKRLAAGLGIAAILAVGFSALAWAGPKFGADGKLAIPANIDRWPTIGTTFALSYEGDVGGKTFNAVRMDPKSYATFLKTGLFPAGTMLDLEIRRPLEEVSPAKGGHVQGPVVGHSIHVKDEKAGKGSWTFYGYRAGGFGTPIARDQACYSCHQEHGAIDTVFTQFYPSMMEAREKAAAGK
ncbi:MAG: hypothetical protein GC155_10510 [Alphaproteobacteria bacterium]|nr:hypothetical protein [Alphaproteobacteria bacterium]